MNTGIRAALAVARRAGAARQKQPQQRHVPPPGAAGRFFALVLDVGFSCSDDGGRENAVSRKSTAGRGEYQTLARDAARHGLAAALGLVWCAAAAMASGAETAESGTARVVVRNDGMTQGHKCLAEWRGGVRDTAVFKAEPAALHFDGAGTAVQSFAGGWTNNLWQQLVYRQGDPDWTFFEKEIDLPAWTVWSELKLAVEGNGRTWLDEMRDAAGEVDPGRPVSADDELRASPPPNGKPWEPAWCIHDWRPAWFGQHEGFVARTRKGGLDVVAFGDSLTLGWGPGLEQLVRSIDPVLTAANYGIGGDSTRQVLWRIENGEVDGLSPRVAIVAIGTNNLYEDLNAGTDEEIAKGIEAVVRRLREKLPTTKVLLVAILPR